VPEIASLGIKMSGVSTMIGSFCLERINPNNYTLLFTIEGTGQLTTSNDTSIIEKNSLTTLPAGAPFQIMLNSPYWKIAWFNLNDIPHWRTLCEVQPVNKLSQRCESVYHALSLIYHEPNKLLRAGCLSQLSQYLTDSLAASIPSNQDQHRLNVMFQYVEQQMQVPWNIEQLCALVCYSASHLHRLCQTRFGRSPMQQVIFLRIERAKYLLRYSDLSIAQIAEYLGYQEVSNFSKRFKKSVGQAPTHYRANVDD
jgi:AraC-like DNA-binding protein